MGREVVILNKHDEEAEDNRKIIQVTLFDDIDKEDIRKKKWILGKYTGMEDVIKNYEFSLKQIENGMSAYDAETV
ncbi:hypothetical protein [Paenibacillus glacialis]|uniref:Uncharacterized protein n=1 Tax=Paenibacillus glacialis TaxID=494026 RepID=A0A168MCR5_9BACL|nr:hypothetical protein [Paenibacillus glacialis]OAB44518.1 hypothetical protein PGLA_07640 [Paenibacillus glacialis]